jgi:hypothetical protein
MDKGEIPENCGLIPVLVEYRAVNGISGLQQVAGTPRILIFPATIEYILKIASVIPLKESPEVMPGFIIF